ncbi:MAG: ABC transporter permease [Actinomycetota bacterium]
MWRATIKSLLARKLRLLLTGVAVVLGVGFVAGTLVLTDTATATFDQLFGDIYAGTDVVVQAHQAFAAGPENGGGGPTEERNPIPESVLSAVRSVDGVRAADGDVAGYTQLIDPVTGEAIQNSQAPTLGNSWDPDTTTADLRRGSPPTSSSQIAIDASTAADHHLSIGQTVRVITQAGTRPFTVSGIIGFGSSDNLAGATVTVFDLATAQRLFGREGTLDHIYVVGDAGISQSALADRVGRVLPKGFEAVTAADVADQQAEQTAKALGFLRTGLLVFAFVSLFVGAFIIFNTFNIIVTQRTRELGLYRAIGATSRQVLVSVLLESLVTGLIASVVGLGAGLLLAKGLQGLFSALGLDLPSTATQIRSRTVIVSLIIGTVITVVASVAPARRASRVAPIQALVDTGAAPGVSRTRRVVFGGVLALGGIALLLYGLFGTPTNAAAIVGLGAALVFVGVAMLSPFVARPLAAWIGAPMRSRGISGKLGRENAMRNPRRTASTSAALMIGLGLVTFVAVFAASLKASATAVLDRTIKADFIVNGAQFLPFSPHVAEALASRPELEAVSPFLQGPAKIGGGVTFLSGVDPATIGVVTNIAMRSGSISSLDDASNIIVSRGPAQSHGWHVGDTITVVFQRTGKQRFTVGGIFATNQLLNDYVVSTDAYDANFAQLLDTAVFVKASPSVPIARARAAIDRVAKAFPNVEVHDQAQFKQQSVDQINQVLAIVFVLLLLAIIISLFGIVNTLSLSIYERVHEIGLLRAVGMSRTQVRRMIRVEAIIIAVLGAILGVVIGVLFGWAMQQALADLGVGTLALPYGQIILFLVLAAIAGVLAAIWPARRAARLDILSAIAYE